MCFCLSLIYKKGGGRNCLEMMLLTRDSLIHKIYKQFIRLNIKNKQANQKMARRPEWSVLKEDIQMAKRYIKRFSIWLMLCSAKSLQSCLTLCDPIDGSPPGSPVPGILQARTLEWVAISFFNAWKWKEKVKSLSCVWFLATPWTAAYQAPPSLGFSRQEYWSGVPLPSPQYG